MRCGVSLLIVIVAASLAAGAGAPADSIVIRECLVISGAGRPGRSPFVADSIGLAVVRGTLGVPREGHEQKLAGGRMGSWKSVTADADGTFRGPSFTGGYSHATVSSDSARVMILDAAGHSSVIVNGEPRVGDVYSHGYVKLPVAVRKGDNTFLFQNGRGTLRAALVPARSAGQIETADATLPDLIVGTKVETWGAVVVVNASEAALTGAALRVQLADGSECLTQVPVLTPLSVRKIGFRIAGTAPTAEGKVVLSLSLVRDDAEQARPLDVATITLEVKRPDHTHKRTFISTIDGSVQYFGLVPARTEASDGAKPGLILTLHGASVEGIGQARVYSPKTWAHIVAPTNRRPFGFDWEDWGRLDALEVLNLAREQLNTEPRRTYLTGHSMGGHGTWHLGVTYPDRWAAIAPSAGWVSMASYAGARPVEGGSTVAELLRRPTAPSDTLALVPNLGPLGVFILHGSADDNVPVGQARTMRKELGAFHTDFVYEERPGAGHWWGNECCDWPPLIEFLRRHELPRRRDVRRVDFTTASPGVSDRCHWVGIEAQTAAFRSSSVHLAFDPEARRFSGTSENVARLSLDLDHVPIGKPVEVVLDGQSLAPAPRDGHAPATAWFRREGKIWSATGPPSLVEKGPHRSGPFKDAFRRRVLFIHGTTGTAEENAWSLNRARFDAERFWYQGNGSIDIVPDSAFDASADPDRNIVVYGHAEGNSAWSSLLAKSPVQVRRGLVSVGDRRREGDDLACLFIRPRPNSDYASIGVVAGTGMIGLRLTGKFAYLSAGVAYPDFTLVEPKVLESGAAGVVAAGFFGNDWGVASGEFAWRE